MDEQSELSFDIDTTDAAIAVGVEIWLDQQCLYKTDHLSAPQKITATVLDDEGSHRLTIVMFGKDPSHTKIDADGNILKDVMLTVSNFEIDGIDVNQVFQDRSSYTHDFNGSQPEISDVFHGFMGCNGTVKFEFTTPMYMWLLENM